MPTYMRDFKVVAICSALVFRTLWLHFKYTETMNIRRVAPIRGVLDAAVDAGILIMNEYDAYPIAPSPFYDNEAAGDFHAFAHVFYSMMQEDDVEPMFYIPIRDDRCGSLILEQVTLYDSLPAPYEHSHSPPIYRIRLITRGVERQVRRGVCVHSPIPHALGRKQLALSAAAHNTAMLRSVMHHVHMPYDPLGYLVQWIHGMDWQYEQVSYLIGYTKIKLWVWCAQKGITTILGGFRAWR